MRGARGAEGRPLVSVVIPVHDGERFLAEAIESSLEQSYRPLEVIVVDDASTDGSAAIAASYEAVKLVRRGVNGGPAAARNDGLAATTGEFISFLDADDVSLPERLAVQAGHLLANPGVDCVLAREEIVVEPGAELPHWLSGPRLPAHGTGGAPNSNPTYPAMSALIRRATVDRIGGFDPAAGIGDDMDWMMRVFEEAEVVTLDHVVLRRRMHGRNLTNRTEELRASMTLAFRHRIQRARAREGD